jgi:hypothetical protein
VMTDVIQWFYATATIQTEADVMNLCLTGYGPWLSPNSPFVPPNGDFPPLN